MANVKGIVRNLDDLGRVVIPMEFRKSLDLESGKPVEMTMVDGAVIEKRYEEVCKVCGCKDNLHEIESLNIKLCPKHLLELKENADAIIKCLKEN